MGLKQKVYTSIVSLGKKNPHIMSFLRKGLFAAERTQYTWQYVMNGLDDHLVLFEAYNGRQYACSPKAIYEEMLKENLDYHYVWVVKDLERYAFLCENPNTTIVKFGSREYFRAYAKAKYWVVNSKKRTSIFKREGQYYIQCWHGTPLKKIGCDLDADKSNAMLSIEAIHKSYEEDGAKYDYLISPSKFATKVFTSAFRLEDRQDIIIETGYPRNDILYNYQESDIVSIKERLGLPKDKKVILYAPTWRDNQHQSGVGYTYELPLDLKALYESLHDDYVVLLRLHYLVAQSLNIDEYSGFLYNVSDCDDINDLYLVSDLLVTDYSSVFFDYANLKRPMFFFMYDYESYKHELRDFYIDIDTLPGPVSQTQEDLIADLKQVDAYKEKYHDLYETFNQTYNALDDGQSSKRVIERCILSHED
ncbi:MAG: CDP-glycerol glycerophosphotransferase family protein [Erysipelotrichaceae bacterium]|nr:CDP-glycerol glycerophosphotransferase family protein [Erysipelotrichaceae bacterium]